MANQDYYQTLGVAKNASDAEIKAAYRKKALEWHPDRNKDPKAAEKFKEINQAYEILSNPQKKQTYDQYGSTEQQQGPFTYTYRTYGNGGENPFENFGDFSDPFEIFEQFFGGGGFSSTRQGRQRRQIYSLEISFLEAVKGAEKEVQMGNRSMKIKIPAGVDNGSRVRFGDFDLVLSVRPDKTFQRDGQNIYVTTEINYPEAVLGTNIEVPTIDGPVTLKIPSGTQPESLIRLRDRGIKGGDQYVRVKIKIPTRLSRDQAEILKEYQRSLTKKPSGWF
ncbi:DnaJ domain-containing protein [Candidatus Gottesmanbacteria bacterium]|nr:DnaJ domain-containing protein [Candidatus Gottesmanbacteria bacterium]